MLPEAAASSIARRHIVSPLRKLLRRTRSAEVVVGRIDLGSRVVFARHSLTRAESLGIGAKKQFAYRTMGQLAIVGERTGVADVMGLRFSGLMAWFLWRTYYLMRIPQLEKRLRVVMDWTLDLFFARDLVQLAVTRAGDRERSARIVSSQTRE